MNNIFCIGLGKLGLIFSFVLADHGFKVFGHDEDESIGKNIDNNKKNLEPFLNKLIKKNKKNFNFETNYKKAINNTNSAFLILPTPSKKNFEFDNKYIYQSLKKIGPHLKNKKKYLINITSTVNPGSCNDFINFLERKFLLKHGQEFILTYNPHLIALGSIYNNIINSDLVILGSDNKLGHIALKNIYKKLYKKNLDRLKYLNLKEAEISKISINSYITMKISFSNCLSQISDKIKNINIEKVLNTLGNDKRIGNKYLSLGGCYSGPCFPRDSLNFASFLKKQKIFNGLPKSVDYINNLQIKRYLNIYKNIIAKWDKKKPTIGICGMSYKDKTKIIDKSPGEQLVNYFKNKNKIFIYDKNIQTKIFDIKCQNKISFFFKKADIIFICYPSKDFKKIGKIKTNKKKVIIDLWNFLKIKSTNKLIYKSIGIN